MDLSPDDVIFWQYDAIKLNLTLVTSWAIMLLLVMGAKLLTHKLTTRPPSSRWQNTLEIMLETILKQISELGLRDARGYLGFLGTLLIFIATANLLTLFPGYEAPTGSLSTTIALALCVFVAVPYFGIKKQGLRGYLAAYTRPAIIMLPFNIIAEISRTLALAVRLFGNMLSASMIIAILLAISPLLFPAVMTSLGLLTGLVQAYIFFVLAGVYIAAATSVDQRGAGQHQESEPRNSSGKRAASK